LILSQCLVELRLGRALAARQGTSIEDGLHKVRTQGPEEASGTKELRETLRARAVVGGQDDLRQHACDRRTDVGVCCMQLGGRCSDVRPLLQQAGGQSNRDIWQSQLCQLHL